MKAIVCAVQPSKEGCSKDHALSNHPLGSSQATRASHRQDCALVVLMEKKINGDNSPSTQPAVLMGNKSGSKCHCTKGAV